MPSQAIAQLRRRDRDRNPEEPFCTKTRREYLLDVRRSIGEHAHAEPRQVRRDRRVQTRQGPTGLQPNGEEDHFGKAGSVQNPEGNQRLWLHQFVEDDRY